jgi:hypothetical protein
MDYITCFEVCYILYTNESIIKYGVKKLINTEIGNKLMIESVRYVYKRINNIC